MEAAAVAAARAMAWGGVSWNRHAAWGLGCAATVAWHAADLNVHAAWGAGMCGNRGMQGSRFERGMLHGGLRGAAAVARHAAGSNLRAAWGALNGEVACEGLNPRQQKRRIKLPGTGREHGGFTVLSYPARGVSMASPH
eukprot:162858-Chlamydomonas_euryale.AAC.9